MTEKQVKEGEVIFVEEDVADVAYIVLSGSVDLTYKSAAGQTTLGTIEAGGIFGELAVFDNMQLRTNSAVATVDSLLKIVTTEDFQALFAQCPADIKPFLNYAFAKAIPARTKQKTQETITHLGDISKISFKGVENLAGKVKEQTITLDLLPFRIGGYPENGEINRKDKLHLPLPSSINPQMISRQHCEIIIEEDKIVVSDLGSRFGVMVNDIFIGRGRGIYQLPLQKGENTLVLGLPEAKYTLLVTLD